MSEAMPLLKAENITAGYVKDLDILSSCNIELHKGELVGIIGPNGAGKSTLLKVIFNILPARSGKILLDDVDITNTKSHRLVQMGIGYIPQIKNIFSALSVSDNLRMGGYQEKADLAPKMENVFELFPKLREYKDTKAGFLSGGEAQMVAMGRALMMEPSILLLDEPSAGLSPINRDIAFQSIQRVVDAGVSAIMVEQSARTCLELCNRAYVLDNGTDAYTGKGKDLLHDPKVIELYLGSLTLKKDGQDNQDGQTEQEGQGEQAPV